MVAVDAATLNVTRVFLEEQGVPYEARTVSLSEIDERASRANQVRKVALIPEAVERYAIAYGNGAALPELILNRVGNRLVVVAGNNRIAGAKKANILALPALIISVDPREALRLGYIDNARNGEPPSQEERLEQAVSLVNAGMSPKDAASQLGLNSPSLVGDEVRYRRALNRAGMLGIGTIARDRLPKTSLLAANQSRDDDEFAHLVKIIAARGLNATEVKTLAKQLNSTGVAEARRQLIDTAIPFREPTPVKSGARADRVALLSIYSLIKVTEDAILDVASVMTQQERTEFCALARRAATKLTLFADTLE